MNTKKQKIILLSAMLSLCCYILSAQPMKQSQDSPTPPEITAHNQPYVILQKEIKKNYAIMIGQLV